MLHYSKEPRFCGLLMSQARDSGLWLTWKRQGPAALTWLLSPAIPLWLWGCGLLGEVIVDQLWAWRWVGSIVFLGPRRRGY